MRVALKQPFYSLSLSLSLRVSLLRTGAIGSVILIVDFIQRHSRHKGEFPVKLTRSFTLIALMALVTLPLVADSQPPEPLYWPYGGCSRTVEKFRRYEGREVVTILGIRYSPYGCAQNTWDLEDVCQTFENVSTGPFTVITGGGCCTGGIWRAKGRPDVIDSLDYVGGPNCLRDAPEVPFDEPFTYPHLTEDGQVLCWATEQRFTKSCALVRTVGTRSKQYCSDPLSWGTISVADFVF